ncbi:MAG: hypothetical protein ACKVIF_06950 [Rhodospirillales bacterium]
MAHIEGPKYQRLNDLRVIFLFTFIVQYFCMLLVFSYDNIVRTSFMITVTEISAWLIQFCGLFAETSFSNIEYGFTELKLQNTTYRVHDKCAGLPLVLLVTAAVGALPAKAHLRILGFVTMATMAGLVASLRIVILGWVAEFRLELFEIFHTYIMEVFTVVLCVALFALWGRILRQLT